MGDDYVPNWLSYVKKMWLTRVVIAIDSLEHLRQGFPRLTTILTHRRPPHPLPPRARDPQPLILQEILFTPTLWPSCAAVRCPFHRGAHSR